MATKKSGTRAAKRDSRVSAARDKMMSDPKLHAAALKSQRKAKSKGKIQHAYMPMEPAKKKKSLVDTIKARKKKLQNVGK